MFKEINAKEILEKHDGVLNTAGEKEKNTFFFVQRLEKQTKTPCGSDGPKATGNPPHTTCSLIIRPNGQAVQASIFA